MIDEELPMLCISCQQNFITWRHLVATGVFTLMALSRYFTLVFHFSTQHIFSWMKPISHRTKLQSIRITKYWRQMT